MKLALFGYGGHAREVAAHIRKTGRDVTFFVDDLYAEKDALPISCFDPTSYTIMIAVGDSKKRETIVQSLPKETTYFTFVDPTAILLENVKIGEGRFVGACCVLTCDIEIGKHAILNRGVHIGHDCKIGNYFSAMPGVILSGNITVKDRVYVGTNASIREKIDIEEDCLVGISANVIKSTLPQGTYIGNPATLII